LGYIKEPELEETVESDLKLEYCPYYLAQASQPLDNNNLHPPRPTTENPGYVEVYDLHNDKVFNVLRDHKQTKGTESYHEYNTLACAVSFLFDLKQSCVDFAEELAMPFDGSDLEEVARRPRSITGQVNSGQKTYDILNRQLDIAKHENVGQLSADTKLLLDEVQSAIGGFDKGLGLTTSADKLFRAALEAVQERDRKASATAGAKLRDSEHNKTAGGGSGGGRASLKPKSKARRVAPRKPTVVTTRLNDPLRPPPAPRRQRAGLPSRCNWRRHQPRSHRFLHSEILYNRVWRKMRRWRELGAPLSGSGFSCATSTLQSRQLFGELERR
jgi:hypothetical protein